MPIEFRFQYRKLLRLLHGSYATSEDGYLPKGLEILKLPLVSR